MKEFLTSDDFGLKKQRKRRRNVINFLWLLGSRCLRRVNQSCLLQKKKNERKVFLVAKLRGGKLPQSHCRQAETRRLLKKIGAPKYCAHKNHLQDRRADEAKAKKGKGKQKKTARRRTIYRAGKESH